MVDLHRYTQVTHVSYSCYDSAYACSYRLPLPLSSDRCLSRGWLALNTHFQSWWAEVLVDTAHSYGVKVAAHATNYETVETLLQLDIDSIEHGFSMQTHHSIISCAPAQSGSSHSQLTTQWVVGKMMDDAKMPSGCSRGPLVIAWTRLLVVETCASSTWVQCVGVQVNSEAWGWLRKVLRWGTLGGWELGVRKILGVGGKERLIKVHLLWEDASTVGDNKVPFGTIRDGFAVEIITTAGDLERNFDGAVSVWIISSSSWRVVGYSSRMG